MPRLVARFGRVVRLWAVFALIAGMLAACGGSSAPKTPTPTAMPMATQPAPAFNPTIVAPAASPLASPGATPMAASQSISRSEFEQQLFKAYPMGTAGKDGGTLILGSSGDISTVNPVLVSDTGSAQVVGAIFETLVGGSPIDGSPVPALADSWNVAPDGLTYTFHINQNAKWQDGVDITADDVKFSYDAALNPNTGSAYTTTFNEYIASYRVIDANTFEVTARDRFVSFLLFGPGSIFIVPQHIWGSVDFASWSFDDGSTGHDPSRVVGSGPFKFKEWVQGDHVTIEKNPDYYGDVPHLDSVVFRVTPDTDSAVLALEHGDINVMEILPPADTKRIQDNPAFKVDIYPFNGITLYMMNLDPQKTELFQDVRVRQALMTGLDRESIKNNLFNGYGDAAIGTQPPLAGTPTAQTQQAFPAFAYDPAAAKQLLADAGWTDSNGDGVVDRDGKKMEFTMIYGSGDSTVNSVVSYLQDAWKAIGVKVKLSALDGDAMGKALQAHDFDMAFVAFSLASDQSQTALFACNQYEFGLNYMKYCNQQWDALDEQQKREFDPQKRQEILTQQSQIVWSEQGVGVVRFGIARTGYSATIQNFYPTSFSFLWSLPYVWIEQ